MRASSPHLETKYDPLGGDEIAAASERSPSFDVAAVASVAGLRDSRGNVPLDFCVPRRTSLAPPADLDGDAALVLFHVDGLFSLKQIAGDTRLSLSDTIEIFFRLLALGLVEAGPDSVPRSTVVTKVVV